MQSTIQYIQDELAGVYPEPEIRGLVRMILESLCGLSYTEQILQRDRVFSSAQQESIHTVVKRLKMHEPIQYILGETMFFGLRFKVNPAVLIPRPETEELVHLVLEKDFGSRPRMIDIGTGSGCIALALKSALPKATVHALDVSEEALATAAKNAQLNELEIEFDARNVLKWREQNWAVFDAVISNPPYVRNSEKREMEANVLDFEPGLALFVNDDDPLLFYREISAFAQKHLKPQGWLFFEINESFGDEMCTLVNDMGFSEVDLRKDINGRFRMLACRK